jgi:DNA-binding NarL/FixJ family response regulator
MENAPMIFDHDITVLLVDDHAVVRQGVSSLLTADGHFRVIGEARNGREAVRMALTLRPDVILMDIAMPTLNGLDASRQILAANPAARVLILSAHSEEEYVKHMNKVGVAGFIEKQTSPEILATAIREVAKGNTFFSPSIAKRWQDHQHKMQGRDGLLKADRLDLTARESEVLQLVAEGLANKQIAGELGISIKTVEKHRQHLMDKLNIHEIAGLTRYAIAAGVVESRVKLTIT